MELFTIQDDPDPVVLRSFGISHRESVDEERGRHANVQAATQRLIASTESAGVVLKQMRALGASPWTRLMIFSNKSSFSPG